MIKLQLIEQGRDRHRWGRGVRIRIYEWGLRWAAKLTPWLVGGVVLMMVDFVTPPHWGVSALYMALLLIAFQFLARRNIPRLIVALVAFSLLPYFARLPLQFEPVRLWVPLGLLAAVYYHNDSQRRRKRRLLIRKQLQRSVRRRAIQVRRINEALRREIARRQATQQRLNRTETHLQSLAQRMQLQVIRKDIEGVITYANDAFCRGIGRPVNEVIGSTDADLYPPALAEAYRLDDERVLRSGEAVDHIESHPTPDGKTGWVQVFKAPDYDDQNKIIGIQMVFWDVTDSYRKTAELRRSEARKRALFDAAREAVLLVDDQGLVVEANPAAVSMLSKGDTPLAGHRLVDIALPESSIQGLGDEPPVLLGTGSEPQPVERRRVVDPSSRSPLAWSDLPHGQRREIVLRPKGEANFPAEVSIHPIPLENSIGLAIFIRDVTLRHRALAALRDAKSAAEDASRIKSEFMASVSHEIRTPLGGITGSAELLSQMALPPKALQYVDMIRHSGELLSRVIGDILDLASIEAGRLKISPEPSDLHRCVGEAFRFLATRAMGKDVELVLDIRPSVPRQAVVDANRLRQIVINLAGNAIKFTPQGHVILRVDVQCDDGIQSPVEVESDGDLENEAAKPQRWLHLEMIDSGIGIPPQRLEKIFEPFEQGDSGTTRRFGGTGLGLSISDQLVKRMGGSIQVTSEPGHGSTFRCVFPLVEVEPDDTALNLPVELQPTKLFVAVQIAHPLQRRAIIDLLVTNGYTVADDCETRIVDVRSAGANEPPDLPLAAEQIASGDSRVIWLARVDDPTPHQQRPDQPILLKPILPDDLLRLLRSENSEPQSQAARLPMRPFATNTQSTAAAVSDTHCLLLVDDSPVNQAVIRDFLTGAGYHVDLASSGQEAINAAESRRYACVLMDLQMPGMDGIEAMTQMVQQDERRGQQPPPFVALTAHATDDHRVRCLNHGMKAFLVKPIDRQALIGTIDSLVSDAIPLVADFQATVPAVFVTGFLGPSKPPKGTPQTAENRVDSSDDTITEQWRARLLKAAGNDPATAGLLAEAFLEEVPRLCKNLSDSLGRQDARAVRIATHTLKSCLKYVAEPPDWQIVERCETLAMEENLTEIALFAPQVQTIAMRWVDRLKQSPQSSVTDMRRDF